MEAVVRGGDDHEEVGKRSINSKRRRRDGNSSQESRGEITAKRLKITRGGLGEIRGLDLFPTESLPTLGTTAI